MITNEQLHYIVPNLAEPKRTLVCDALNKALDFYKINGDDRKDTRAILLAQLAHESGEFKYLKEIYSGKNYEGRVDLGNTEVGDGTRFVGRGYLQITGRANYTLLSKDLGIDFVNHPELLEEISNGCLAAVWYWETHRLSNVITQLGPTMDCFKIITKKINGGYTGLSSRLEFWERAKKVILC